MIRQIPKIALFVGALALAGRAIAGGGGGGPEGVGDIVAVGVIGAVVSPGGDRTVYENGEPFYVKQRRVYSAPPPVYYQPAPVYQVVERYPPPPPPGYYHRYGPPPGPGYYYGPPRGRW
ncbi:hypothetical protein [Pseudomonas syringae]|uniref:hypothetical protein n=1 Tax=Pseudomonas syringae TaxID=317 RepID=UPI001F25C047|nr:hypothetical protein [Pseudomonas syringae]MCF5677738.1 hypothetical protein [Pseudomonas syringae]